MQITDHLQICCLASELRTTYGPLPHFHCVLPVVTLYLGKGASGWVCRRTEGVNYRSSFIMGQRVRYKEKFSEITSNAVVFRPEMLAVDSAVFCSPSRGPPNPIVPPPLLLLIRRFHHVRYGARFDSMSRQEQLYICRNTLRSLRALELTDQRQ